jgi:hypothetical protein
MSDTYVAVNPQQYSFLVQSARATYGEYMDGNNGGYNTGKVMMIGGVTVLQTNQLPSTAGLIGFWYLSHSKRSFYYRPKLYTLFRSSGLEG